MRRVFISSTKPSLRIASVPLRGCFYAKLSNDPLFHAVHLEDLPTYITTPLLTPFRPPCAQRHIQKTDSRVPVFSLWSLRRLQFIPHPEKQIDVLTYVPSGMCPHSRTNDNGTAVVRCKVNTCFLPSFLLFWTQPADSLAERQTLDSGG